MKYKRITVFVLFLLTLMMCMGSVTFAKSKSPYKDVTRKKVDAQSYDAIVYIKNCDGWRGLVKKGKFYPNKAITRREFLVVLHNLYGDKVPYTMDDIRNANAKITSKYACDRMVALSKVLGYSIRWDGNKTKLKRKDVARYVKIFATFNKAFTPQKASTPKH